MLRYEISPAESTNPKGVLMSVISRPVSVLAVSALALAGALVAVTPAAAAVGDTYHVATTGDDTTGDGSLATPYLTIAKAVDEAVDGDAIVVGEGTFAGFSTDEVLIFEGFNSWVAGEDWAGSVDTTIITGMTTPRIVRTHEVTQEHLNPIYIGSQMNLGLSGPTPVIGTDPLPAGPPEPAAAVPPATPPAGVLPGNASPTSGSN